MSNCFFCWHCLSEFSTGFPITGTLICKELHVPMLVTVGTTCNVTFFVGIPSQKSWGRKKAEFYDADIVEEYAGELTFKL